MPRPARSPREPLRLFVVNLGGDARFAPLNVGYGTPSNSRRMARPWRSSRDRTRDIATSLHSSPQSDTSHYPGRHRGRDQPILFSRRQVDRVLREYEIEEGRVDRWGTDHLADALSSRGGTWAPDDTIVFQIGQHAGPTAVARAGSWRQARPNMPLAGGETTQVWPQILSGGRALIYTSRSGRRRLQRRELVGAIVAGGSPHVIQRGGYHARYLRADI